METVLAPAPTDPAPTSAASQGFIAPAKDIAPPPAGADTGFIAPANEVNQPAGFTAPNEDIQAHQVFDKLDKGTVADLAKDTTFRPVDVVADNETALTPAQIKKLAEVERQKHEQGVTAASVAAGTKGAWEGIKQFGGGVVEFAKHVPSILKVAKAGLTGDASDVLNATSPEDLKKIAEVGAGAEANATGYAETARGLVRNAVNSEWERKIAGLVGLPDSAFGPRVNADVTRPSTFLKPVDWEQRLKDDAALARQNKQITEAGGELANLFGGKEALATAGVKVDPEVVAKLASVEDPTIAAQFLGPLVKGLTVTGSAAKGFTIASAGKTIATAATKEAADNFVAKVGNALAKTGAVVTKTGKASETLTGILSHASGASAPAAIALSKAPSVAGKILTWSGKTLANPNVSVPVLEAAKRTAAGAVEGAAIAAPFAAGQDLPEDAMATAGAGALLGAAGRNVGHAVGKAKMDATRGVEYAVSKAFTEAPDVRETGATPAYGTDAGLDKAHASAMTELQQNDPQTATILNRVRNLLSGNTEVYYVSPEEFAKQVGKPNDAKLPFGVHLPATENSPAKILIRQGGEKAAFHEAGHALISVMPENTRNEFYNAIQEHYSPEQLAGFKKEYEQALGGKLKDSQVTEEVGAELISAIIHGVPLDGTPLPLRQRALSLVGRLGETLGLYSPEGPGATTTTGRDLGISPNAVKPAQDFVSQFLSGKEQPEKATTPPVITPEAAGAAPAAPAAAPQAPVTPEHQSVIEGLKKSQFPKVGQQAQAIADKLNRGEALTPKEQAIWDAVNQATGPKIANPQTVAPPKIEPVKPAVETPDPAVSTPENNNIRVTPEQQDAFAKRAEETGITEAKQLAANEPETAKRVNEISNHMQSGNPVLEIEHLGIKSTGDASAPEGRTSRRATQAKGYQDLADIQADNRANAPESIVNQHQKTFVPVRWTDQGGTPTLVAMSVDKVIHNLHRAVSEMGEKAADLIPYENKDGKLTEKGWQEAVKDVQAYNQNQANGYRGNGEKLTRPSTDVGASIPAENPDYTPTKLSEEKEQFLNLVQGINTPETARIQKNQTPGNIKGQEIAKANKREPQTPAGVSPEQLKKQQFGKPFEGQSIKETNPLRNELRKRGVNVKDLIEVTERIRAKDVQSVKPRSDLNFEAPVTDTIRGGFLPSDEATTGTKELDPDWQVTVQKDPRFPAFGYVQIDDVSGGKNHWSKSPKTLRQEGYNIPDSLFDSVPHGKYKMGDVLNGDLKPIKQKATAQFQPVTTKAEKIKPNDDVRRISADYVREASIPFAPHTGNQEINVPLAKRIADFYQDAKHEPETPAVKKSYDAFVQETKDQWRHLTSEGYKMEPWTKEGQPYKNSAEMAADVRDNKHLWYFPTEEGFGTTEVSKHPLLEKSGIEVNGKDIPVNDVFRTVHDIFGHSAEGYEFGPRGELNAFLAHASMYSEAARPAMAAETLGQNSWVNFGKHLRDVEGNIPKKGETGHIPLTERPFAEQKATVLPKGLVEAVRNPREAEMQFLPSKEPRAIKQAAIQAEDGTKFEGPMHLYAHMEAAKAGHEGPFTEGFITNDGEFLDREQAFKRAVEMKQYQSLMGEQELESGALATQQHLRELGYDEGTDPLSQQFLPATKRGKAPKNEEIGGIKFHNLDWDYLNKLGTRDINLDDIRASDVGARDESNKLKPKTWMLPDNKIVQTDSAYHENYLRDNHESLNEKYGTNFDANTGAENRFDALKKGFVRIAYTPNGGEMRIEALASKFNEAKQKRLKSFIKDHIDKIDRIYVSLLDDKGGQLKSDVQRLIDYPADERMDHIPFITENRRQIAHQFQPAISDKSQVTPDEFKSEKTIDEALKKPGWSIMSATQEAIGDANHEKNRLANRELADWLDRHGYDYTEADGFYKGANQGRNFIITGIKPEEALALGREFGQESVLVPEGLLYNDGTLNPIKHEETMTGEAAELQDFYSKAKGGPAFSLGLDFSKREPFIQEPAQSFLPALGETGEVTPEVIQHFMPAKEGVDLKDYIGKPLFVLTTDRMGVGSLEVGPKGAKQPLNIPAQGGRGFMHIYKGGGWAFADEGAAKRFLTRVRQVAGDNDSAIAALTVLGPENHLHSPTGLAAYQQAIQAAVDAGAVGKGRADAHIKEIFNRLGQTKSKLVTDENRELFQSIKSLKSFGKAVAEKKFNFEAAKHLMERARGKTLPITVPEAEDLGIDVASIARDTRDPGLHDVPTGQVVGLVEIPKDQTPTKSDFHFSYPWTVEGKAIGFLNESHHVGDLTSDQRIYQAPGQVGAQPLMTVMPHLDKMEQLAMQFMPSKAAKPAEKTLAQGLREKVRRAQLVSVDDAVKTLGEYPKYLDGVVNFLADRREALKNGNVTTRDLAKAYAITVASQGSDSIRLSVLQKSIPDFKPDKSFLTPDGEKIRPEEAAAWWLGTPEGQKALDNVQAGKYDAKDWEGFAKVRKAFGDDRVFYSGMLLKPGESAERPIYESSPTSRAVLKDEKGNPKPTGKVRRITVGEDETSMANLETVLEKINEAKGDKDKLMEAVQNLRGIGPAKAPFISHLLGFGGDITLDAVEQNYWLTGKGRIKEATPKQKEFVDAVKHDEGSQAILKDRIVERLKQVRERVPAAAAIPEDSYLHVMHHWLWDRAKGSETTHEGVYEAALQFQPAKTKTADSGAGEAVTIQRRGKSARLVAPESIKRRDDRERRLSTP